MDSAVKKLINMVKPDDVVVETKPLTDKDIEEIKAMDMTGINIITLQTGWYKPSIFDKLLNKSNN